MARTLSDTEIRRLVNGRVIVITGASRGLGAGMAERFRAHGATLALCARSAISTPATLRAAVDVTDPAQVSDFCRSVARELGPIDLWINNAGVLDPIGRLHDVDLGAVADHVSINVVGVFNGSQAYIRHLRNGNRNGALVNISSGAAINARAGWAAYCASKAAVDRLTETIALEEPDMRVLAVAPGVVDTDMQALIRRQDPRDFPSVEQFAQRKRVGAFNSPSWVADRIAEYCFSLPHRPEGVVVRVPDQPAAE